MVAPLVYLYAYITLNLLGLISYAFLVQVLFHEQLCYLLFIDYLQYYSL